MREFSSSELELVASEAELLKKNLTVLLLESLSTIFFYLIYLQ